MARWKLTQPHYLTVPGTKWEYIENDRTTGRPVRKQYDVPLYLNPEYASDWTHIVGRDLSGRPQAGDINVCHEGKGEPGDVTFVGPPTPDMVPLDEEAKQISARLSTRQIAEEDMPQGGYAGYVLENLGKQLSEAMIAGSSTQQMDKFLESQQQLTAQLSALIAALAPAAVASAAEKGTRRGL